MKFVILAALVALAVADKLPVAVLHDERVAPEAGVYSTNVQLDNGISLSESGSAGSAGQTNVQGSYSYVNEHGEEIVVHYSAGENGFVATGEHLPVAPEAPAYVAELLAIAEQQRKDGIKFE
ncbi:cuticle protein AM1159-like [Oratosquilla oratoria]|uniref:cuticle protein AM1159-like n=1 Tax=Oratosquilla oratoria TaxID=337810 RepID=UPI003F75FC65